MKSGKLIVPLSALLLFSSFFFPGCAPVEDSPGEDPGPTVSGTLSVEMEYEKSPVFLSGTFSGNRGVYIWVTDKEGKYIDTIQQYYDPFRSRKSRWRDDNPLNWIEATGREYSLDGVTSASIHGDETGTYLSEDWDCLDSEESPIPQDTYQVWIDVTTHDQWSVGSGDYIGDPPKLFSGEINLGSEDSTAEITGDAEFPTITVYFINE